MENIQRSDLTLYEQAQGFQMMLDLGDSIDEIARKSGFSQTTVRRRVKLLELDQEKFKASVSRGANLMDYMDLDKIEDPELKNEVLEAVGTNNFRQKLARHRDREKPQAHRGAGAGPFRLCDPGREGGPIHHAVCAELRHLEQERRGDAPR